MVLIVIGLLLGGVLKGQELVTQARTRNVVAEFSGISAAYHGYHDRYRACGGTTCGAPGSSPEAIRSSRSMLPPAWSEFRPATQPAARRLAASAG